MDKKTAKALSGQIVEALENIEAVKCDCVYCQNKLAFLMPVYGTTTHDFLAFIDFRVEIYRGYFQVTTVLLGLGIQFGVRLK